MSDQPHVWRKPRDTVVIFCPPEADEAPSWLRGTICQSLPPIEACYHRAPYTSVTVTDHCVLCSQIKWLGGDWGPYDGVPLIVAREYEGGEEILEYVACVRNFEVRSGATI